MMQSKHPLDRPQTLNTSGAHDSVEGMAGELSALELGLHIAALRPLGALEKIDGESGDDHPGIAQDSVGR